MSIWGPWKDDGLNLKCGKDKEWWWEWEITGLDVCVGRNRTAAWEVVLRRERGGGQCLELTVV